MVVNFKTSTRGAIQRLAMMQLGSKVYGEGQWKVKRHCADGERRVGRKHHLASDTNTREIVAAG